MTRRQYRSLFDLSGKCAVVTGAVGILGRRFCAALADCGAAVAVVDLDEARCAQFAAELRSSFDVEAIGIGCDVRDGEAVETTIDRAEAALGPVDVLLNNAATKTDDLAAFFEPLETYAPTTWREVMAVNVDGAFLVAQAVGRRMADRGRGSIIQTASIYGIVGADPRIYEGSQYLGRAINTPAVYAASKAAVIGLSRHLATHWGPKGVRVNTLIPGGVASGQNQEFSRRYSDRVPLGRMAEADEMCGAIIFLAADASSYVTGQSLVVDGGLSAW